jgi:hypothetical protein
MPFATISLTIEKYHITLPAGSIIVAPPAIPSPLWTLFQFLVYCRAHSDVLLVGEPLVPVTGHLFSRSGSILESPAGDAEMNRSPSICFGASTLSRSTYLAAPSLSRGLPKGRRVRGCSRSTV